MTDEEQKFETTKKLAENGDCEAQIALAVCYYHGYGVEKDHAEATKWAARKINEEDKNQMSCFVSNAEDDEEDEIVFELLSKATGAEYFTAQNDLGYHYYRGLFRGQDYDKAAVLYAKAAEQGHAPAQFSLGWCYLEGLGVEDNRDTAIVWFKKAAAQGEERAIDMLEEMGEV